MTALALAGQPLQAAELAETVEKTLMVGEAPRVAITHVNGMLRLRAHGAPQMVVRAVKRARASDEATARAALSRSTVAVEGAVGQASLRCTFGELTDWEQLKKAADEGKLEAVSADCEILVPRRASVELNSVRGEILIAGVEGGLAVNAVSNSMLLERIAGGCRVTATSGNVTVSGAAGGLAVQTVGGDVDLRGLLGACVIDTVGGAVNLILDPLDLQAARVHTVSGPVTLQLPVKPEAFLHLETAGGTIGGDYPLPPGSARRRATPARGRGPTITVQSASGDISLKRLKR